MPLQSAGCEFEIMIESCWYPRPARRLVHAVAVHSGANLAAGCHAGVDAPSSPANASSSTDPPARDQVLTILSIVPST